VQPFLTGARQTTMPVFESSCTDNPTDDTGLCDGHLKQFFNMEKDVVSYLNDHPARDFEPYRLVLRPLKKQEDRNRLIIPFRNNWRAFFNEPMLIPAERIIFKVIYGELELAELCNPANEEIRSILRTHTMPVLQNIQKHLQFSLDTIRNSMSSCVQTNYRREFDAASNIVDINSDIESEPLFIRRLINVTVVPKIYSIQELYTINIETQNSIFSKDGLLLDPLFTVDRPSEYATTNVIISKSIKVVNAKKEKVPTGKDIIEHRIYCYNGRIVWEPLKNL
jgi:hypothetical protein